MSFTTSTLTGKYLTTDGDPASGVIEIIPNSRALIDPEGNVILSGRVKVTLDETGSFSVTLPATDDTTVEPATGRQYAVSAKLKHTRLQAVAGIELAGGETVDMADVTPAAEAAAGFSVWLTEEEYAAVVARVADLEAAPAVTKASLGLGSVDNTSDANKPISTATQAAFNGLSATYVAPSKVAPAATGVAATDTAALQAAITATPAGGTLYLRNGVYALNAALTCPNHINIVGESSTAAYKNRTNGGFPQYPTDNPPLTGVVLKMTVAATDVLKLTGSGKSYNLANLGIWFQSGLATTGHGIDGTPTQTYTDGHDYGPTDCKWSNLSVYGHDGNHYAYILTNHQYVELYGLRSYYGGGFLFNGDGTTENWGNLVAVNPYVCLLNAGTAGGYVFNSVKAWPAGGSLNLMTFIRPQCNILGAALAAGTQFAWKEDAGLDTGPMSVLNPDFEGAGSNISSNPKTSWSGHLFGMGDTWTAVGNNTAKYVPGVRSAVAIGGNALKALTSGSGNVAVGGSSMTNLATGADNTAVGETTMYNATPSGSNNVAVGRSALFGITTGSSNIAVGKLAGKAITTGGNNVAVGDNALQAQTTNGLTTAVGAQAGFNCTGSGNTLIGQASALGVAGSSTATNLVAVGQNALNGITSGVDNVGVGQGAGVTVTAANATTSGARNVFVGRNTGQASATQRTDAVAIGNAALIDGSNAVAIGSGVSAGAAGAVAIGKDNAGTPASTTVANDFVLGTALHSVKILNNTTGAGSAALGANSPATINTAPFTWFKMKSGDGSVVYVPAWK